MNKFQKLIDRTENFFKNIPSKKIRSLTNIKNKNTSSKLSNQFNEYEMYTYLLCSGEGENGINHLDLWIPLFESAEIDFFILLRHHVTYKNVKKKYPHLPIVYAKRKQDIDFFLKAQHNLKAVFYPSNNGNNIDLLGYNKYKHIFIGHGDSDKLTSAHKRFRVYDENWVAGEAHIDRFRSANFDVGNLKQVKVGRPLLKNAIKSGEVYWKNRFNEIKILYLSTWEGSTEAQNYSSIDFSDIIFRSLGEKFLSERLKDKIGFSISFSAKLHPALGIRDSSKKNFYKFLEKKLVKYDINVNFYQDSIINDLILQHNVFICDISGAVTECLAVNSPIFLYIPLNKEVKLSRSKMPYEYYTYTYSTVEELLVKFERVVINGDDYLSEKRSEAIEYILGKKETLNDSFYKHLKRIESE